MINRIRCTITLCFLMAMLTGTAVTQAQPPLGVPSAPEGGIIVVSPILLMAPEAGETVNHATQLVWNTELSTKGFKLRFTISATGESFTYKPQNLTCASSAQCGLTLGATGILDHLGDGDGFLWRVIAKDNGQKYKSAANYQIADTVNAPEHLLPADDSEVGFEYQFRWDASSVNKRYTVVVRDAESGQLAGKAKVNAIECGEMCSLAGDVLGLPEGNYKWFVKAKGFNDDTAKSDKQNITLTSLILSAL